MFNKSRFGIPALKNDVLFYEKISAHGIKGFVVPTKSFVEIGIAKIFCYNNKMFSSINKTFGCCYKIFGYSNKKKYLLSLFLLP